MNDWISKESAVEIIRQDIGSSVGRSHAILRTALKSGEVREQQSPVLLTTDDGMMDLVNIPGAVNKGGISSDNAWLSREDLLDWLRRHRLAEIEDRPLSTPKKTLPIASAKVIRNAIREVYKDPASDQPNINQLARFVRPRLNANGYESSDSNIRKIGEEPEFSALRRKIGRRKNRQGS